MYMSLVNDVSMKYYMICNKVFICLCVYLELNLVLFFSVFI